MTQHDNVPKAYDKRLDGLGGWLILLAIFLIISPLYITLFVISTLSDIVPLWAPLTNPSSPYFISGIAPLIVAEIIGNFIFVALFIYGLFLFFTKNRKFPKLLIFILIANLIFLLIDDFLANMIMKDYIDTDEPESLRDIYISGIRCVIWIPYLLNSKRVFSTFRH